MGSIIRKYAKELLRIAFAAAMPGMLIFMVLLLYFVVRGTPHDVSFSPAVYLRLLLICYATAFITTCVVQYRSLIHAAIRSDAHLIGKSFSGIRKQDRLFCDGVEAYSKLKPRTALDLFLEVQEYELTDAETGVLSFYIGRCYQMLSCPSNAIPYYEKAIRNGFSKPFAQLFEARSYAEGGSFGESYEIFCDILEHDPPEEFYFLYTDIGYLYIRQNMPEQAAEWFQRSITEKKNYAFALSGMAIVSLQRGDFKAAQDYHYKALVNRLEDPSRFRRYYEDTRTLMLEEHPEWDKKTGKHPAAESDGAEESA